MEKSPPKNLNYDNYGFYWQIFGYTDDMWVQTWSIFFTARFARQRWCRFDQGWGVSRCLKVFLSRWETHIVWSHITGDLFGMPQPKNGIAVSWTSDYLLFQKGWCLHIAGIVFLLLLVWICQVWLDLSWPRSQWILGGGGWCEEGVAGHLFLPHAPSQGYCWGDAGCSLATVDMGCDPSHQWWNWAGGESRPHLFSQGGHIIPVLKLS